MLYGSSVAMCTAAASWDLNTQKEAQLTCIGASLTPMRLINRVVTFSQFARTATLALIVTTRSPIAVSIEFVRLISILYSLQQQWKRRGDSRTHSSVESLISASTCMRQSVNTHHDDVACRGHAVPGATPAPSDHALFPAGLASSSWAFTEDVPAMDRPVAVTYSCFDPPPTPASFLTPSSLAPPGIFHATARVGELPYCQNDADSTPPYFIGDRRLPPEVLDRATSGVYGGISMQYRDTKSALTAGCVPGAGLCSSSDDRDCTMRSVLLAGDSLMRTPANLTPPPSVFAWRGGQTSCSSSTADHRFPPYFTNFVVDQSSCHSPVGADRESVVLIHYNQSLCYR